MNQLPKKPLKSDVQKPQLILKRKLLIHSKLEISNDSNFTGIRIKNRKKTQLVSIDLKISRLVIIFAIKWQTSPLGNFNVEKETTQHINSIDFLGELFPH